MPIDQDFASALINALQSDGWSTVRRSDDYPNPFILKLTQNTKELNLIIYARTITPQARGGSNPSTHNRPPGEMHMQMVFDDSERGKGKRNFLDIRADHQTLLLGFTVIDETYVIAAFDTQYHYDYGYSKSLQVKDKYINNALKTGLSYQNRKNGETVIMFRLDGLGEYLMHAETLHDLTPEVSQQITESVATEITHKVISYDDSLHDLPILEPTERKRVMKEVSTLIRDSRFSTAIKSIYSQCATCGFQYDYVLDAAHIIPVAEGGTDTLDNGLGLCPRCHRLFDKGYILIDNNYMIFINPTFAEHFQAQGLAGSLDRLQAELRPSLWLPADEDHWPSQYNLKRIFDARRG